MTDIKIEINYYEEVIMVGAIGIKTDEKVDDIIRTVSKVMGLSITEFIERCIRDFMFNIKDKVDVSFFDSSLAFFNNKPRTKEVLSTIRHWLDLKYEFYRVQAVFLTKELEGTDYDLVPELREKLQHEIDGYKAEALKVNAEIDSITEELKKIVSG